MVTRMAGHIAALGLCAVAVVLVPGCTRPPRSGGPHARPPATLPSSAGTDVAPAVPGTAHVASTTVPVPGACNVPRTGPADAVGCYVAGTELLGPAPASPVFWHIDTYPTRAAAEAARRGRDTPRGTPRGTVAEAHGRVWLFTVAEAAWRPEGGERVARVGPLPVTPGRTYAAHYLEGVVPPGARTPVHRHAGPEAWYVLEGAQCLETPDGIRVVRAGESLVIPEGPPMLLTGVGRAVRRTLVLVVHDAAQRWTIPASDWTPTGTCPS